MIKNVYWSSCKIPVILVRLLMKHEFLREIFEKYSNIKFHEIPVGAESFRADARTGKDEA